MTVLKESNTNRLGGYTMCACEGTGVIKSYNGLGGYTFMSCRCEKAKSETPAEQKARLDAIMENLKRRYKEQLEAAKNGEIRNSRTA